MRKGTGESFALCRNELYVYRKKDKIFEDLMYKKIQYIKK